MPDPLAEFDWLFSEDEDLFDLAEPTLDAPARLSRVDDAIWHAQADEADEAFARYG